MNENELRIHIQDDISCWILFADAIVLVDETSEGVN